SGPFRLQLLQYHQLNRLKPQAHASSTLITQELTGVLSGCLWVRRLANANMVKSTFKLFKIVYSVDYVVLKVKGRN
ncbi:MAG: hypothetical protein OIF35_08190, partial [Cellvibrionaceae bacterium]|nr:hypothetical protein [Cellvibrionaceae bacterium]